jgi:YkoY family integral membrane protein
MDWGTFVIGDLVTILTLVILEGLLSVDNAVVLAVMVRHLPDLEQKRALRYGIFGAFAFRVIAVFMVTWLLHFGILKLLGGLYMLGIAVKHSLSRKQIHEAGEHRHVKRKSAGMLGLSAFWSTVVMVELADIVFSADSILAARAMSPKTWIVIVGGMLGILTMRMVAGVFLKLIERFPKLVDGAYVIIAVIGIKLILEWHEIHIEQWLVISIIFFIFGLSLLMKDKKESEA